MNREAAMQLINAINELAKYCPPFLFERAVSASAMQTVLRVANGEMELTSKPPLRAVPPTAPPKAEVEDEAS